MAQLVPSQLALGVHHLDASADAQRLPDSDQARDDDRCHDQEDDEIGAEQVVSHCAVGPGAGHLVDG